MSGAIPLLPQHASMALFSVKAQGQLYLLPLVYAGYLPFYFVNVQGIEEWR
jgi:hypothetical protein